MTTEFQRNIVLCGFMGTGKSAVGRLLSAKMGRPFVDMDRILEERFDRPITEVFAELGEAAFRAEESKLAAELGQQSGMVIATGGGAILDPANREALGADGVLVCLWTHIDRLVERLGSDTERPLLHAPDTSLRSHIEGLLRERRPAYELLTHHLDSSETPPVDLVEQILDLVEGEREVRDMARITVQHPGGAYHICLGEGLLRELGSLMRTRGLRPGRVALISNTRVAPLYAEAAEESLRDAGYEPVRCVVPDGEAFKTLESATSLYGMLLDAEMSRSNAVVALGGGVIGDLAGFVASTYMRGVPFIQVPTTLLAMVDASVGGKTAVDLPQGKNLVGAFKQPELVLVDPDVLATLDEEDFRSGLAEVIKHGIIGSPDLFGMLAMGSLGDLRHLVSEAVRVKVSVVESDPFEAGRRAVLNLGHTFGHAIEKVSNFGVRHGYAVAIGMVAAARLAVLMGEASAELEAHITRCVEAHGLPVSIGGLELDALMDAMVHDKKKVGRTLRFIIPKAIGQVVVIDHPGDALVRDAFRVVLTDD